LTDEDFMTHLERGGTLSDLRMDDLKAYLKDKYVKGRLDDLAPYKSYFSDIYWEDKIGDEAALLEALYDADLIQNRARADLASPPQLPERLRSEDPVTRYEENM
jgi:hypothetical protein